MSKKNNFVSTEEKIVAKALEMFNERGIEYVGLREIAATLEIRVSNITYYFPTKDDLVNRLSLDLNKLNSEIVINADDLSIGDFILSFEKVFHNHLKYRCLLLSFVHLMENNKKISARYKKTQADRNATLRSNLMVLASSGYLSIQTENEIDFLVACIAIIARFWISESVVSFKHLKPEEQLRHYVGMIARTLLPYTTAKGRKELQNLLLRFKLSNP